MKLIILFIVFKVLTLEGVYGQDKQDLSHFMNVNDEEYIEGMSNDIETLNVVDSGNLFKSGYSKKSADRIFHYSSNQYFFGYNGFQLHAKEIIYTNDLILYNTLDYGVTDFLTVGVGSAPLLFFVPNFNVWATARASFPAKGKIRLGIGGIGGVFKGSDKEKWISESFTFAYGFGNLTYGNRRTNVNIGLGYLHVNEDYNVSSPIINISAMIHIVEKLQFITENYAIVSPENTRSVTEVFSLGLRMYFKKVSIDPGISLRRIDGSDLKVSPILGVNIRFGTN